MYIAYARQPNFQKVLVAILIVLPANIIINPKHSPNTLKFMGHNNDIFTEEYYALVSVAERSYVNGLYNGGPQRSRQ